MDIKICGKNTKIFKYPDLSICLIHMTFDTFLGTFETNTTAHILKMKKTVFKSLKFSVRFAKKSWNETSM